MEAGYGWSVFKRKPAPDAIRSGNRFASRKRVKSRIQRPVSILSERKGRSSGNGNAIDTARGWLAAGRSAPDALSGVRTEDMAGHRRVCFRAACRYCDFRPLDRHIRPPLSFVAFAPGLG